MCQNNLNFACIPFNFSQFEAINQQIRDVDTTLLYATLFFQIGKSKLFSHGTQTVARAREQICSFLKLTPNRMDRGIKRLEKINFIKKTVHNWFGKKRLFISKNADAPEIEVHFRKLFFLNQFTGNSKASLLWAKIAFALNNTKIEHENKPWCALKRETIADLLCVSLRTVDSLIDDLEQKGLIFAQKFVWRGKRQLHFTIPVSLFEKIEAELALWLEQYNIRSPKNSEKKSTAQHEISPKKEAKLGFCEEEPAKIAKSIRIKTKYKYKNNNTSSSINHKREKHDTSDINLNTINENLNHRQLCFLRAAFQRTIETAQLTINEEAIFEEIKFNILNPVQRKGILSFKHAVSRCMQLLRQRTWRTPFGFNRYAEYGKGIKVYREAQLQAHEARKKAECSLDRKNVWQMEDYTTNGIRWAKQLTAYIQESQGNKGNNAALMTKIEFAANRVVEFISKGADRLAMKPYLPAEVFV